MMSVSQISSVVAVSHRHSVASRACTREIRRHLPSTASMTARAMGPARRPPAISSRAVSLDSTSTATATLGSSAGANDTNQAYGGRSGVDCAVPVLPPTSTPAMRADVAVPTLDGADHHLAQLGGVGAAHGLAESLGLRLLEHPEVGRAHGLDDVRLHDIAVVGDAGSDHRHLQRRRRDLVLADAGLRELRCLELLSPAVKRLALAARPSSGSVPKPNFAACAASFSWPILPARAPKATLHETLSARSNVIELPPQLPPFSLGSVYWMPGNVSRRAGLDLVVDVVDDAVLERRGGGDELERRAGRQRLLGRAVEHRLVLVGGERVPRLLRPSPKSWLASRLGSYDGWLTIASTAPVCGSSATTAPLVFLPSRSRPSAAAFWASGSIVSSTLPPLGCLLDTRSTTRLTNSRLSLPDRTRFCEFSSAPRPKM